MMTDKRLCRSTACVSFNALHFRHIFGTLLQLLKRQPVRELTGTFVSHQDDVRQHRRRSVTTSGTPLVALLVLTSLHISVESTAQTDEARLLIDVAAEVSPDGVALSWTVDEERAHLIAGFTCVYQSPSHLRLSVNETIPCNTQQSSAEARSLTISKLPEYGEYLFELVAQVHSGAGVAWPLRAMHYRIEVTQDLAGPPGPTSTVTDDGPLIEGCGSPVDQELRWHQNQIVSEVHLTHHPGRGWIPGGDPVADPEWPEPTPIATLIHQAGIDLATVLDMLEKSGGSDSQLSNILGEPHAQAAIALAGAGTKSLLRERGDAIYELKLHSSYPFGSTYRFETEHLVFGWGDSTDPVRWPALWRRVDCPPPASPGANHNVSLAFSREAGHGRQLAHSGYGWWTVAPVSIRPDRIVAAKAGFSFGESQVATEGATWQGRATGHLFKDKRRFALAGDVTLELRVDSEASVLKGRIDNIALVLLDSETLRPLDSETHFLPSLTLAESTDDLSFSSSEWSGPVDIVTSATTDLLGTERFEGDWSAATYGSEAEEATGHLRLWTTLPTNANPSTDWPMQTLLVTGFGAVRQH